MPPDPFLQSVPSGSDVAPAVMSLHEKPANYAGRCTVQRGQGWLIALALFLGRFPSNGVDIPVRVKIEHSKGKWTWVRDFDGHTTRSVLTFDHGTACVREQLGWITLWLTVQPIDKRLVIHIQRLSILGLRCPGFLLPKSSTTEWQDAAGRFCFDVGADMPGLGNLIRYRGWLNPVHDK